MGYSPSIKNISMMGESRHIVLQTKNLFVGYSAKHGSLLADLNLELRTGELVCFMGPNGIGKSTLIRTLSGLQKPLSGSVTTSLTEHTTRQIAVVLTEKISAVNMTVHELITFGRYPYLDWNVRVSEADKEIIDESISQVHIESLVNKRLYELSDGQLQMAMIARALVQATPIIILDEPTAHLDLNNRVEVMQLLRTLARKNNKAILMATHELDLALQTSDLIWLTGKEKNIITGIPEDLVLNGAFDSIFKFKGFDLKTGKIHHETHRATSIQVIGEGHTLLWTKNALQRNGFNITDQQSPTVIYIHQTNNKLSWTLADASFTNLTDLLDYLIKAS
jgi:iron complex transport system ATP-binding protein